MAKMRVAGINDVLRNLNNAIKEIGITTSAGLIKSAMHVRMQMEKKEPKIPVDTSNLRSSWFFIPPSVSGAMVISFGFTASYAWPVHEAIGRNFRRPGAGAKFLEAHLNGEKDEILRILRDETKL